VRYWIETLGCPKNHVDSDKLEGLLGADGYELAESVELADLVVVNTCAFIEAARTESIDTILELEERRKAGARLVVTGCMAERYGDELAEALPEVDQVARFDESFATPTKVGMPTRRTNAFDLLNLPRPAAKAPWAYLKVAEGCDRRCGFCAIPSFRGDQRSRSIDDLVREAEGLVDSGVKEIVLIAQDLASYGHDRRRRGAGEALEVLDDGGDQPLISLIERIQPSVERLRLLYLYPSGLTPQLIDTILATNVPYFDLSLQHVSRPLVRNMKRWGDGDRFLERIAAIRHAQPTAAFRSSFIVGYPGETEEDQRRLVEFLEAAQLDWAGFFTYSPEDGTVGARLANPVDPSLALERLRELTEVQDRITAAKRDDRVGTRQIVLMDSEHTGRSTAEAPEIDGLIYLDRPQTPGSLVLCEITASRGVDLEATVV
jgi:ribosomal protein S12 methylthiotransferase